MDHGCLTKIIVQIGVNLFCVNSQCANSNWNIISIMISNWPTFNEPKSHNLIAQILKDFSQFHYFFWFFWSNSQFIKTWVGPKVLLHLILWWKAKMKCNLEQKIVYVTKSHCWKSIRLQGPPMILKCFSFKVTNWLVFSYFIASYLAVLVPKEELQNNKNSTRGA